ncbi:hypothetical protein GGF32_007811 [Allomyces javanicus]|nr:hypothetical protein GGF32_007811 [Allomyces javanicus]
MAVTDKQVGWLAAASGLALLAAVAVLIGGHTVHAAPAAIHAPVLHDAATQQWAMQQHGVPMRKHAQRVHYHGAYHVSLVRLTPAHAADLPSLHWLLLDLNVDVWAEGRTHVDVRTADTHALTEALRRSQPGVHADTIVADVEKQLLAPYWRAIDERTAATAQRSVAAQLHDPKAWFAEYHDLDEIYEWYRLLAAAHKDRITITRNVGTTHEGREIMALRFTNHASANAALPKKQIYVQGGIHAREWISHAIAQYIAFHLATSNDTAITALLDEAEVVLVPVVNPDGYAYTWTTDRIWRKNRRNNGHGAFGVDLNRNYPAHWGEGGSFTSPFVDKYMGPSAGSEPELQALMAFFDSLPRVVAALDLHSFSQVILRPLGWTGEDAMHEKQHKTVGDAMAQIIKNVHGTDYVSEKLFDFVLTSGTATDWFYMQSRPLTNLLGDDAIDKSNDVTVRKTALPPDHATVFRPYSFTLELRPLHPGFGDGFFDGFMLDPSEIVPVGEEVLPAFLHFARFAMDNVLTG